jgi:phosphate transport system substrate-binding protein
LTSGIPFLLKAALAGLGISLSLSAFGAAAETVRVGGTGIGLAFMRQAGERLRAVEADLKTDVLPSLGTNGGLKALIAGELDVALSARAMKADEAAKGLVEGYCVTTALIFASSRPDPAGVTAARLPSLYAEPQPAWPDGRPLKVILRARSGSENPLVVEKVPAMASALEEAYRRPGMPIGASDQENAELVERTDGSLGLMSLMQVVTEKLKVYPLPFEGVKPTPASIGDGSYPMPLKLCLVLPAKPSAGALRLIRFLQEPEGRAVIEAAGAHGPR